MKKISEQGGGIEGGRGRNWGRNSVRRNREKLGDEGAGEVW